MMCTSYLYLLPVVVWKLSNKCFMFDQFKFWIVNWLLYTIWKLVIYNTYKDINNLSIDQVKQHPGLDNMHFSD